jgi:hypothetical protein
MELPAMMRLLWVFLIAAVAAHGQTIGSGVTMLGGVTVNLPPPPVGSHSLTITKSGTGTGTVTSSPTGINCGTACIANYTSGTGVTLTATPDANNTFDGWSGSCSGTGTCSLTMTSNLAATTTFTFHTPPSGITFTPPAGTYTGTQNVTVTQGFGSGNSIFCTTDGSSPSPASPLYTGPIAVATSQTLSCMAYKVGTVRQEMNALAVTNNTATGWKLCLPVGTPSTGTPPGSGSPTWNGVCTGGVGTNGVASGWLQSPGTTETITISSQAGAPQILIPGGSHACDNCTEITQDKWIKPTVPVNGTVENHELDLLHIDHSRNRHHAISLQCNQQSGTLQWEYNHQGGSWHPSGITDGCPLSTTLWTHVIWHGHWIIGDTGCGGLGCDYFDYLEIGTATDPSVGATMTTHNLNVTLPTESLGWGSMCSLQDQVDLRSGGTYPKTGGVMIRHNNVTCGNGISGTNSATYTIH